MTRTYLDLETCAAPLDQLQKFMPADDEWPLGNATKPETVARIIQEKKLEWIYRAALSAVTGQIVAIAVATDDNEPFVIYGKPEKEIIEDILINLQLQLRGNRPGSVFTWNGAGFDFPFLCQRAAVHGQFAFSLLTNRFRGRYSWNENLIDAKQVWSMYSPDHRDTSLAKVALALGVGEKTGKGKDFAELLKTDKDKAIEYARNDVALLRKIVQAMGI